MVFEIFWKLSIFGLFLAYFALFCQNLIAASYGILSLYKTIYNKLASSVMAKAISMSMSSGHMRAKLMGRVYAAPKPIDA